MLYHLLYPLHEAYSFFNVFRYITFRTIYAAITSLIICFVIGPWLIRRLRALQIGQTIREDGPDSHLSKKGTPTMGGILIIFAVTISTLLWANLTIGYIWLVVMVMLGFGLIGFLDDYRKFTRQNSQGVPGKIRLTAEIAIALFVSLVLYLKPGYNPSVTIPFFKTALPNLGWGYVLLSTFIIVGAANAVNLTDGLDGLAIGPAITCFMTYLLFAYFAGNVKIASYLQIPYVAGTGELAIFCGAIVGAGHRISLVQRVSRPGLHGGCGRPLPWRFAGRCRRSDETGNPSGHRGGDLCHGDVLRHLPGRLVQTHQRQAHLSDGPDPSPFRT